MIPHRLRKNYKPPFGYDVTEGGNLIPLEEDLAMLEEINEFMKIGAVSLREGAKILTNLSSRSISHEGLKKRLKRGIYLNGDALSEQEGS